MIIIEGVMFDLNELVPIHCSVLLLTLPRLRGFSHICPSILPRINVFPGGMILGIVPLLARLGPQVVVQDRVILEVARESLGEEHRVT